MYVCHIPSHEQVSLMTWNYRVVYALIIINKAGGLIYQRDFADGLNKLSVNDYLVLAGTFHGYPSHPRPMPPILTSLQSPRNNHPSKPLTLR